MGKERKSIRLKEFDYRNPAYYYLTICCYKHFHYLGKISTGKLFLSSVGKLAQQVWKNIPEHFNFVELDEYIIMPNHIHGILIFNPHRRGVQLNAPTKTDNYYSKISPPKDSLGVIVRTFKAEVTKRCRLSGYNNFKWQRNYYEHIIRNETDLYFTRRYIRYNILKWDEDKYNL